MKSIIYMIITGLFVVWAIPAQLVAQDQQVSHIRYVVRFTPSGR